MCLLQALKQFNLQDLRKSILYHDELGFGPDYVDLKNRLSYSTIAKESIKKKVLFETLSEEMRILYVAFTRAREKLIITGAVKSLESSLKRWISAASMEDKVIPAVEVLKGKSYLDWVGMALAKHRDGEKIRNGEFVENIIDDPSSWNVYMWIKNDLAVDKNNLDVDEKEKDDLFINKNIKHINEEIKRRLDYKYKYERTFSLPSNISVSDLKRALYDSEDDEVRTLNAYSEKEVIKPKFLQEEKGLSSAERGTIAHFIMQKLDLNYVGTEEEIKCK